jgi:hypothetical protein
MTPRHTSRTLTLQDILPHLQRVRRLSDGSYLASCPVPSHGKGRGDLNPSLSLREENGRLLWYCHAGCSQEAVGCELERLACRSAQRTGRRLNLDAYARAKRLDAAKLRQWGLTDRQGGGIEIPYKDRNGNPVGEKYRDAGRIGSGGVEAARLFSMGYGDGASGRTPTRCTCVKGKPIP